MLHTAKSAGKYLARPFLAGKSLARPFLAGNYLIRSAVTVNHSEGHTRNLSTSSSCSKGGSRDASHAKKQTDVHVFLSEKKFEEAEKAARADPGKVKVQDEKNMLPIHQGLITGAPTSLLLWMLEQYPESAKMKCHGDHYPLHCAGAFGTGAALVEKLLELHPGICTTKDTIQDKTPIEFVEWGEWYQNCPEEKDKVLQLMKADAGL